jgi:hypothetical protein
MPKPAAQFVARVYSLGMIRYVDVPEQISRGFRGAFPAVRGTLNGAPFRGTLQPRGGGRFRLALNAAVRRAAESVDTGDEVVLSLQPTRAHPVPAVPDDLTQALGALAGGRLAFEAWPPGKRREVLVWLEQAKSEGTRKSRLDRILERLGLA